MSGNYLSAAPVATVDTGRTLSVVMDNCLIECVPNFSEGRDKATVGAISAAISATPGCSLLDCDPGSSTNRTVYTFVGNKAAVVNGAFNAARVAKELIDMSLHKGEHPRFGAMDVCPFIPVRNCTMEDCVECAISLGKRLGTELELPIYLYGHANPEGTLLPGASLFAILFYTLHCFASTRMFRYVDCNRAKN